MAGYRLCRVKTAENPFFLENINTNIYSGFVSTVIVFQETIIELYVAFFTISSYSYTQYRKFDTVGAHRVPVYVTLIRGNIYAEI